jgi:hypothetical protein
MNAAAAERPTAAPRPVFDAEVMGGPDKRGHDVV